MIARRLSDGAKPASEEVRAQPQTFNYTFYEWKLVPKQVRVADAAWQAGKKRVSVQRTHPWARRITVAF